MKLLLPCLLVLLVACTPSKSYRQTAGQTWGTIYHIKYSADTNLDDSILSVMRQIDLSLSPFADGSLVSRLNNYEPVVADSMFMRVFNLSQHVCSISGGVFDPTVAPLVNIWGFGYRNGADDIPEQTLIDSLLPSVGILECSIAPDGTVVPKSAQTEFNFSAVAKGYGVDCIADMLRRNGCSDYMVEVGGELALSGHNPSGADWRIMVDVPIDDVTGANHDALQQLSLTDVCIATSGNYRNYRDTSAGRVAHTISPLTGMPIVTSTLSVTVIAPTCALADALATAAMAMEADAALAMLEQIPDVEAALVVDVEGGMQTRLTSNYSKYLAPE